MSSRCGAEFNEIIKVGGTPCVDRVIITLSRIVVQIILENYVYENSKPVITVIKPQKDSQKRKDHCKVKIKTELKYLNVVFEKK